MLQDVLDKSQNESEIKGNLESIIKYNANNFDGFDCNDLNRSLMEKAYKRLCNDIKLYNWIAESNSRENSVEIREYKNIVAVGLPRSWYKWIYLGNRRKEIISDFMKEDNYKFDREDQEEYPEKYGDYYGSDIWISKSVANGTLWIDFYYNDKIYIDLYCVVTKELEERLKKLEKFELKNSIIHILKDYEIKDKSYEEIKRDLDEYIKLRPYPTFCVNTYFI